MSTKLVGKYGLCLLAFVTSYLMARSIFDNSNEPWETFQVPLVNWYFCEGNVSELDLERCTFTEKPKPIEPQNVGQKGKLYTYFAQYTLDQSYTDQTYALNSGPIGDEDELWIDGKYVGRNVYTKDLSVAFQDWKTHQLPAFALTQGQHTARIIVNYGGPMFGGVLGQPAVTTDRFAQVKKLRYNFYRSYLPFACSLALIFLSLYSGLVGVFGRNRTFFYDYMGFGIFFSLYIGSIGFVYTYMGMDWNSTLLFVGASMIGTMLFSLRLAFQSGLWPDRFKFNMKMTTWFISCVTVAYCLLFFSGQYVAGIMMLQVFYVSLMSAFSYYTTKKGIKLILQQVNAFSVASVLVGPIFFTSMFIDVYREFKAPESQFTLPYALIYIGFFVMLQLAREHVTALRDQEIKNELEVKNQKLKYLSEHDPLTALYNRRTFESLIEYNINNANENKGYALLILDIDHFKAYNDSYGHPAGDRLLISFSKTLKNAVRLSDYVGRLGGEEFGVFLHNVTFDQAQMICEHIRESVENAGFENLQKTGKHVTASVGALYFSPEIHKVDYSIAYKVADRCLYKAKEKRNTVVIKKAVSDEISSEITPTSATT
ncbi:MAG: GGDEF domain-containing protein [Bdellovibrionota bacterium]